MLTYDMTLKGKTSLYEYLYSCIRDDILSGKIKSGSKLPSKRELSANLGISVITVQSAYEQLLVEGYIYSEEKRGYFVCDIDGVTRGRGLCNILAAESGSQNVTQAPSPCNTESAIDFTSSHVAYDKFPYSIWARLMRRTLLDNEKSFVKSPSHIGVYELRSAIAGYLRDYRGFTVSPDNIIIGAGMEYLYGMLVRLLGHSKMIAVEDPGHTKISRVYESDGLKVLHIPIDKNGLIPDKLPQSNVAAVHISPSHQFPTGIVMPVNRRRQLISWAEEYNSYIIEDDYDSEFRLSGKPVPSMASMQPDRVIYMNTFSKTLAPSIRIAYMILPNELMEKYTAKLNFYSCTVSGFEQYTLAAFIKEGYYGRHISRMRNFYKDYRTRIIGAIKKSPISNYAQIDEDSSGLHFILSVNKNAIEDIDFVQELGDRGIKILPLSEYCYNNKNEFDHKFIINYSDITVDNLSHALNVMDEIIKQHK